MKKKSEKKKWGLILFIIFIMLGTSVSFVFFGFQPQNEVIKYNGIKFVKYPDRWEAKINERFAAFSFLPDEAEKINVPDSSLIRLRDKLEIDVTYDLNSTFKESIALAHHQMALTLGQYNVFVRKGFTANSTYSLPIITCNDSTENAPVVYFREGNTTNANIHLEDGCIIAEAKTNEGFIMAKDRILYAILGVIK